METEASAKQYIFILQREEHKQVTPPQELEDAAKTTAAFFQEGFRPGSIFVRICDQEGERDPTEEEVADLAREAREYM